MIDEKALALLFALSEGSQRFGTLQRTVKNPRTLSSKLKALTDMGLVERRQGVYELTGKGRKALVHLRQLRRIVGSQAEISVERIPHDAFRPYIRRFCEALVERLQDNLMGLLVFGSIARGDWDGDSDVDLLIVLRRFEGTRREMLGEIIEIRKELRISREYKECVSRGFYPTVEVYPLEADEARKFRRMYLDALTEGVIVFERESFLTNLTRDFKERLREIGARRIEIPSVGHYWTLGNMRAGEVLDL